MTDNLICVIRSIHDNSLCADLGRYTMVWHCAKCDLSGGPGPICVKHAAKVRAGVGWCPRCLAADCIAVDELATA